MALDGVITSQTGGRQFDGASLTKYSGFVGGVNAGHHALKNYSPLLNGFGRLFMVRHPKAIARMFSDTPGNMYSSDSLFTQFKHMCEYMPRSVTGFQDKTLELASTEIQGGFAGRSFKTPTVTKDSTNTINIGLFEMTGMPIYTVVNGWINAIGDENSGLATYGGHISGGKNAAGFETKLYARSSDPGTEAGIPFNEANHTCEFIYILHDRSGAQVEQAVFLADCFPTGIARANTLDMAAGGSHDNVAYEVAFNCVAYSSPIITAVADALLKQYRIVSNHLNYNPQLGDAVFAAGTTGLFNSNLGYVPTDSATGTNVGNLPAFSFTNEPVTKISDIQGMETALLSGQPGYEATQNTDGFGAGVSSG